MLHFPEIPSIKTSYHKKAIAAVFFAAFLSLPAAAYASVSLNSVSLTVTDSGSRVIVEKYAAGSSYTVKSASVSDDILTIKVAADSGYGFSSNFKASHVNIYGDYSSSDVTGVSRTSSVLTIRMDTDAEDSSGSSVSGDLEVSDPDWNETTGRASWDGDAKKYEVRLYRGTKLIKSDTTTKTYYSFAQFFTQSGNYTFKVRAVRSDSVKGDWTESGELSLTTSEAADIKNAYSTGTGAAGVSGNGQSAGSPTGSSPKGAWLKDQTGWWYCNADRSYTVNNWQYIDNYWYYFDGAGYMVTGWVKWKDLYYCLGTNGNMLTGVWTPDGYYVDANGVWVQSMGKK